MTLFRLDASIRNDGSHSRAIADVVEAEWTAKHPGEAIVRRHVGVDPIPSDVWAKAAFGGYTPEEHRTDDVKAAIALGGELADELLAADAYLFAVPLYNFGVSQHFKAWVDMVITDPRFSAGAEPLLKGRPAVLATVRGGNYAAGTPREEWDHATPWIRRILGDVFQLDLNVVEKNFALVGVNPALDEFKDMADKMWAETDTLAHAHGVALAG